VEGSLVTDVVARWRDTSGDPGVPETVRTVLDAVAAALDGSATEIRLILGEPGTPHRRSGTAAGTVSADGPRPSISWSPEATPSVDGLAPEPLVAILPIRRGRRALGTIEMVASPLLLRDRWPILEAIAAQAALLIGPPEDVDQASDPSGHRNSLGMALHLEAMVGARSRRQAIRAALSAVIETVGPAASAWLQQSGQDGAAFVDVLGVGSRRRAAARRALRTAGEEEPEEDLLAHLTAAFATVTGRQDVHGIRAGEALLVAVAESLPKVRLLEVIGGILAQALRAFDLAERDRHRDERIRLALSWVAHELRGPVLAVKAAIEHSAQDPTVAQDLLDRSVQELEVLGTMIDGWLAWAGRSGHPRRVASDLGRLIEAAAESCRLESPDASIVVSTATPAVARVDASLIRVAVTNLIRNAVAYSPPGTDVHVRLALGPGGVEITVRDAGGGPVLAPGESIFDPFVRGRHPGRRRGNGMGLYITRTAVQAHGGTVSMETAAGSTTFRVLLPVQAAREAAS
jgi:signal transduction histidine kinase